MLFAKFNHNFNLCTFANYIGCIRGVSDLIPFGDPNKTQSTRRKIDIENLNGNIIELALWDEMAEHFGQPDFEKMDQPVIIAADSCRVSKYRDYQLAASPTTYYYLNPNIPEAQESRAMFKSRYQETPPLIICKLLYQDIEKEIRNRYPLKTLMEQNPAIRFTVEATITSINTSRDWYYVSCHQCNKAAITQGEKYSCIDHGPQPGPFFRDSLGTAPMTFFSPAEDKIAKHPCQELVEKYNPTDPKKIPPEVLATQGKTSIFQFHFNTFANTVDLTLDEVFDIKTTYQDASSIAEQTCQGTSSATPTAAMQSVENQDQKAKGKEQIAEEQTNKGDTYFIHLSFH
ncbi:nucleic acid-binding, OB-fold protein [Tanacetum coccineum]